MVGTFITRTIAYIRTGGDKGKCSLWLNITSVRELYIRIPMVGKE